MKKGLPVATGLRGKDNMEAQKSILLLGGSRQQVVAIETAKRLGYRTVLCDYLPDNPGQHVANVFYQESTTDAERMLQIASQEHAGGVLAYASDPAAPVAAYVAEKLGLPTNPLRSVQILSTKHLFRAFLQDHGFPCPRSIVVDARQDGSSALELIKKLDFPIVIKPTDSSGSKGVAVIESFDNEALLGSLDNARSFSRNGILIAEEYIQSGFPRVIGGDVFVQNGEVVFWGLMSCLRDYELGGLVPIGERYPSGLNRDQERRVRSEISRLVSELGIEFGEFNVEIIVDKSDAPYFLEFGARAGGNMIPIQLSDISGIDLVEANVRHAMGDCSMDVSFNDSTRVCSTYVVHAREDGVFQGLQIGPRIKRHVYRWVPYLDEGSQVERFDGAQKALGILFLSFDNVEQLEKCMDIIQGEIVVKVES